MKKVHGKSGKHSLKKRGRLFSSLAGFFMAVASPASGINAPTHAELNYQTMKKQPETYLVTGQDGTKFQNLQQNENGIIHPASTAKLMTMYLVAETLRAGDVTFDDKVTISPKAAGMEWVLRKPCKRYWCSRQELTDEGKNKRRVFKGWQKIALKDALALMMVRSANEVASSIGAFIADKKTGHWKEQKFVEMMNAKAKELGMKDTHFINASGLPTIDDRTKENDHEEHQSTAKDMMILTKRIIKDFPEMFDGDDKKFTDFMTMKSVKWEGMTFRNTNKLVREYKIKHDGVTFFVDGLKTGTLSKAGTCLLATAKAKDPLSGKQHRIDVVYFGGKSSGARDRKIKDLFADAFKQRFEQERIALLKQEEQQKQSYSKQTWVVGVSYPIPK